MRLRVGYLIAAGVIAAAAGVVGLAAYQRGRENARPPAAAAPRRAEREKSLAVGDLQLKDRDPAGKLRWRVKSSGKIDFDRQQMIARGSGVRWELARADGDAMLLSAPEFVVDYPRRRIALSRGVEATSSVGGLQFGAARVDYNMATEHLLAGGPVNAVFRDYRLAAGSLSCYRLAHEATLGAGVDGGYRDFLLTAGTITLDTARQSAVLTGSPRVRRGQYTARADRAEVDGVAQHVRLSGGVRLQRGDTLSARAPRALLGKLTQRAEMSGGVHLTGQGFTGSGARLVVDAARSRATLSGGVRVCAPLRW